MERTVQTQQDEFTPDEWRRIDDVLRKFAGRDGALIPALEEIQGITGYLPESVQRVVARGLGIPLSQVYGVVTFYSFFTMKPRGKYQFRCCQGTACHVRGGRRNLDKLERMLGIKAGSCTDDRIFGIEIVRCLGACGLAPVMTVNDDIHKQVRESHIGEILDTYKAGRNG